MSLGSTLLKTLYRRAVPGRTTAESVTVNGDLVCCRFRYIRDDSFHIAEIRRLKIRVYADSLGPSEEALWRVSTTSGLFNISHNFTNGIDILEPLFQQLPGFDVEAYRSALGLLGRGEGTFACWRAAV